MKNELTIEGKITFEKTTTTKSGKVMQTVLLNYKNIKKDDGTWENQKIECKLFNRSTLMKKGDKVVFKGNIAEENWTKDDKKFSKTVLWVTHYDVEGGKVNGGQDDSFGEDTGEAW